jgi:hypothetical protein
MCNLLALLGSHHILHVSRKRVKRKEQGNIKEGVQLGSRRRWKDALYTIWDNSGLVIRIPQVLGIWRPIIR